MDATQAILARRPSDLTVAWAQRVLDRHAPGATVAGVDVLFRRRGHDDARAPRGRPRWAAGAAPALVREAALAVPASASAMSRTSWPPRSRLRPGGRTKRASSHGIG